MRASILSLVLLLLSPSQAAQDLAPAKHQALVAGIVAAGLSEYHYAGKPLDDGLSACWYGSWLDDLDPDRSFLTAGDVAEFSRWERRLDDSIRAMPPDLSPAFQMHARFRQRAAERVAWTRQALAQAPDLTDAETIEVDRSELPWPADPTALQDVWRRELEEDWLRLALDGEEPDAIRKNLGARLDRMDQAIQGTESMDLVEGWLDALTACYDPHTLYMKPFSADDFAISTSGSLEGIGAALVQEGEMIAISEILPGGPAQRGGELMPDDRIVAVAQGDQDWVDVVGMRLDKVVQLIRGPKGTDVRLRIIPAAAADPSERKEVRLERDRIDLEAVEPTLTVREEQLDGATRKVAVIEVPAFVGQAEDAEGGVRPSTTERVAALLKEAGSVDAVVLDLRENGGGLLDEAVSLTGLFIERGPVVQIRDGKGQIDLVQDQDKARAWAGPLVVLTSPMSASASEIVAGALQDYGRAVVVGSASTYGKGSVQTVVPLDPILAAFAPELAHQSLGGVLKITFSQYYLPGGRSTQAEGVAADVVLPSPYDGRITLESERPHALPADAIPAARFKPEGDLSTARQALRDRSAARVAADPRFQALREWKTWLDELERQETLSLVLATRKAEVEARKQRSEDLDARIGKDQDPVLDEASRIAADLASLG
ncbi:carboxy terminal-processing peptidase [Myxococcota bacterium]|nr:carboxy terminal-processing peptidase [Myxococcota bacterium]